MTARFSSTCLTCFMPTSAEPTRGGADKLDGALGVAVEAENLRQHIGKSTGQTALQDGSATHHIDTKHLRGFERRQRLSDPPAGFVGSRPQAWPDCGAKNHPEVVPFTPNVVHRRDQLSQVR